MGLLSGLSLKKNKRKIRSGLAALLLSATVLAGTASANPTGPTVKHGQVNISPGVQTQIQQLTDKAIIDWNSFSIGAGESVRFIQPGDLSVILNRVTGGDASRILGRLDANGNIFLINPNGILFGPDSTVNVGGLVASTLNITDQDFLAGNYNFFTEDGNELAAVVNQGTISITDAGYAVLTGPSVINEGTIVARSGNIILAAGEQATLNLDGRDLVHFALQGTATDGTVLLSPGMMTDALASTFGVTPDLRADKLVRLADGSVQMVSSAGTLVQGGLVSVDGSKDLAAGSVILDSTDVTILSNGSVTSASGAGENSQGGDVLVLSALDGRATARGFTDVQEGALVAAKGGTTGDAGFIEVSGDGLNLLGELDLTAPNGQVGSLLLDPVVVTIVDGDNAPATNPATSNTLIGDQWFSTITADLVIESLGDIIFDASTPGGSNGNGQNTINFGRDLTFRAGNDGATGGPGVVEFRNDGWTITGLTITDPVDNFTIEAPGGISLGDATIELGNSFFELDSEAGIDLGTATITLDESSRVNTFVLESVGLLDMNAANITVNGTGSGGNKGLRISSDSDIDFGSSTFDFLDRITGSGSMLNLITAGGDIRGDGTNDWSIVGRVEITAQGSINLPAFLLDNEYVGGTGNSPSLFQTATGDITLANGGFNTTLDLNVMDTTPLTINSAGALILDNFDILLNSRNDLLVTAAGDVTLDSVAITQGAAPDAGGQVSVITTGGGLELIDGTSIRVDPFNELNSLVLQSSGLLNLADANLQVEGDGAGFNRGLRLVSTGSDIDLGTSTLQFNDRMVSSGSMLNLVTAAGDIRGTGPNDWSIVGKTEFTAGGSIDLPNFSLDNEYVGGTGNDPTLFQTTTGSIVLANGGINNGLDRSTVLTSPITIDSGGVLTLQNFDLGVSRNIGTTSTNDGDILMTAVGDIALDNVDINQGATPDSTDRVSIISTAGTLSLSNDTNIEVAAFSEGNSLVLQSAGLLDLGDTDMAVNGQGGNSNFQRGLRIISDNSDIDLGSSNLLFNDRITGSGAMRNLVTAGGSILSTETNDWSIGGYVEFTAVDSINLAGFSLDNEYVGGTGNPATFFQTTTGDISLANGRVNTGLDLSTLDVPALNIDSAGSVNLTNFDIAVNNNGPLNITSVLDMVLANVRLNQTSPVGTTGPVTLTSGGGLSLGDSAIRADGNIGILGSGTVDLGTTDLLTPLALSLSSNTEILSGNSTFQAGAIRVFGFDPLTNTPESDRAVPTGVRLGLSSQASTDNIDLTIFSDGDIDVFHQGPGSISLVTAGQAHAIRSTGGNVSIDGGTGTVNLNPTSGGFATVHADANAVVSVSGSTILDNNVGNPVDIFSAGEVIIEATTEAGTPTNPIEVQGLSITLDMSQAASPNTATLNIVGANQFLKAIGNQSNISITDGLTSNALTVANVGGIGALDLSELTATDVHYADVNGVRLDSVLPGTGKTVAVEALSGNILGGASVGNDAILDGDLLLIADGSIGTQGQSVRVEAARVSVQAGTDAGDEIYLETASDELTVADVSLENHLGATQVSGQGVRAGGDIELQLTGASPHRINQTSILESTQGGVALVAPNGGVVQQAGQTIVGQTVVLDTGGSVGAFNGTDPTVEVAIQADQLLINNAGDTIVNQATGDLSLVSTANVGGQAYTATRIGQDLRVRASDGNLSLDGDLEVTGEAALVTGTNSVISQLTSPANINLNGTMTSGTSLTVLAGGSITHQSGLLTSPDIGLGASGTIGTTANPVQIQADGLALNPSTGNVNDPDGFAVRQQVTAAGVTVNQGTAPPTPPPTNTTPVTVTLNPANPANPAIAIAGIPDNFEPGRVQLPQNNLRMIEEVIELITGPVLELEDFLEPDPTRLPVQITDDDFLRKKFRR